MECDLLTASPDQVVDYVTVEGGGGGGEGEREEEEEEKGREGREEEGRGRGGERGNKSGTQPD